MRKPSNAVLKEVRLLGSILDKYFPEWQDNEEVFQVCKSKAANIIITQAFCKKTKLNNIQVQFMLAALKQYGLTEEMYEELTERNKQVWSVMMKVDNQLFPYVDWRYLEACKITNENIADATLKALECKF